MAPEWWLMVFATTFAILSLTSLSFFTDKIQRGIQLQSSVMLGGDLVVSSSKPIRAGMINLANHYHLQHAQLITYLSMLQVDDDFLLVNVQAVSETYPLLTTSIKPKANGILVDQTILSQLNTTIGARIKIGDKILTITGQRPNNSISAGVTLAPSIMITIADAYQSNTIHPQSRVEYRLLLTGNTANLQAFQKNLRTQLKPYERLISVKNQESFLKSALAELEIYFRLGMMIVIAMAVIVVLIATSSFVRTYYRTVAIWRSLGASTRLIFYTLVMQVTFIAVLSAFFGALLGLIVENYFVELFSSYIPFYLPEVSGMPFLYALFFSLSLLYIFSLPLLYNLSQSSPTAIWQSQEALRITFSSRQYLWIFFLCIGLLLVLMGIKLTVLFIIGVLCLVCACLYFIGLITLNALKAMSLRLQGVFALGFKQLLLFENRALLQYICFTLIFTAIMTLNSVQYKIVQNWRQTLPAQTPNYFVFNISAPEVQRFVNFLKENHTPFESIYPMIRGRILAINNMPIDEAIPPEAKSHNALHRALNLTFTDHYPSDNKIIQGHQWSKNETSSLVSVEANLAKDFHIIPGDILSFQVGENVLHATVANLRTVDWRSFHPNFYMIFPKKRLLGFEPTYITSIYLSNEKKYIAKKIMDDFPTVTIININDVLQQLQAIIQNMIVALQMFFFMSMVVAIGILIACLLADYSRRRNLYRLLNILGATHGTLVKATVIEFSMLILIVFLTAFILNKIIVLLFLQLIEN